MGLNVIMLGAPGAGKGTQAERFARQYGLPKVSTGDILRQGIKDNLPVALVAKAKMDRGELVDDETIMAIVRERLKQPDTSAGFVLDGFPRTVSQARALDGAAPCRRIVASERVYLVPRPDDRLIVGATVEEQGFDTTVTAGGVHELLREAYRVLPEVAEMELVEASAGLRPGTADNLPLVGPSPVDGLLWATGHYRNGILLAPLAADTIVDRLFRSHFYPHSDEKCERNAERVLR